METENDKIELDMHIYGVAYFKIENNTITRIDPRTIRIMNTEQTGINTSIVRPALDTFHCELYQFRKQEKLCDKQCESCKWIQEKAGVGGELLQGEGVVKGVCAEGKHVGPIVKVDDLKACQNCWTAWKA